MGATAGKQGKKREGLVQGRFYMAATAEASSLPSGMASDPGGQLTAQRGQTTEMSLKDIRNGSWQSLLLSGFPIHGLPRGRTVSIGRSGLHSPEVMGP